MPEAIQIDSAAVQRSARRAIVPGLDSWCADVCAPALGSSRLVLALCAAFAAPLALLLRRRPFLVHFYGPEAWQRVCTVEIAAAVYGDLGLMQAWSRLARQTKAAVTESVHDGLLMLHGCDDLEPRALADAAALLWSDAGGAKACAALNTRRDTIALSSGERLLDPHAVQLVAGAGKVWMLNIPAQARAGREGIFEGEASATLADLIVRRALDARGLAGLRWLRFLNYAGDDLRAEHAAAAAAMAGTAADDAGAPEAEPFTALAAADLEGCFGLLRTAGELASAQGLTGWPAGAAAAAVAACRRDFGQANAARLRLLCGRGA